MQLKNRYKRDKTEQFKRENQKEATNCCCKAKCNAFVQYLKLSIEVRENKIKLLKLKRYKLKVIYFIGITFYYFSTAIYFTVFYSTEFLFLLDMMEVCKKERERENSADMNTKKQQKTQLTKQMQQQRTLHHRQ